MSLKHLYQRPRPEILHWLRKKGFSFPSGHSLAVTLLIGSLIVILGQRVKDPGLGKLIANFPWTLSSRCNHFQVYLGVHYPSDVLASLWSGSWDSIEFPFMTNSAFNGDLKASKVSINFLEEKKMEVKIKNLHPTQLYLSEKKFKIFRCFISRHKSIWINRCSCIWRSLTLITRWASGAYQALLAGRDTISAGLIRDEFDVNYIISMASLYEKERYTCSGFKSHILPQDEYRAKMV